MFTRSRPRIPVLKQKRVPSSEILHKTIKVLNRDKLLLILEGTLVVLTSINVIVHARPLTQYLCQTCSREFGHVGDQIDISWQFFNAPSRIFASFS